MTEFTFKLILIFIPGIIAFIIVDRLTIHREAKLHHWFIYSFLLGFLCYLCWFVVAGVAGYLIGYTIPYDFLNNISDPNVKPDMKQILMATVVSFPMGMFVTKIINDKRLNHYARRFKASEKFGDTDVFEFLMNSDNIPKWVIIRDSEINKAYEGFVTVWSDTTERDGLFLRDVKVYENSTGEWLYDVPALYLPKKMESLRFEFPNVEYSDFMVFGNNKEGEDENGKARFYSGDNPRRESHKRR